MAVYYNAKTQTKIAYIYQGMGHVIAGNDDIVTIYHNRVIAHIDSYVKIESYYDDIAKPQEIILNKKWPRIAGYHTYASEQQEYPKQKTSQNINAKGPVSQ